MNLAPVILFVYNRPEHTLRTLESLMGNTLAQKSELFIFADGAKDGASQETLEKINRTRAVIQQKKWCKTVTISENQSNKGLSTSILEGVSKILNEYGKVIVLEDDLVTAPSFLNFMNEGLDRYAFEKEVACLSGYVYPLLADFDSAFFIKGADCWGWATWKDRWESLNANAVELRDTIIRNKLTGDFTFNGTYPYLEMLTDKIEGKNQSWAILWYASSLINNHLCLYPPYSLVNNIGNDGSGTHNVDSMTDFDVVFDKQAPIVFPEKIIESSEGRKEFERFFRSLNSNKDTSVLRKIISKIRKKFSQ